MHAQQPERPIDILAVDDSPGDLRLMREALKEAKIRNRLHTAAHGEEALAFLRREAGHESAPTPDLILLDLNMPRLSGREVLAAIKADELLRHIPVVVLTTSDAEADVVESYRLQVNCYITKPVDLKQFLEVVRSIEQFWLQVVTLPKASASRRDAA